MTSKTCVSFLSTKKIRSPISSTSLYRAPIATEQGEAPDQRFKSLPHGCVDHKAVMI